MLLFRGAPTPKRACDQRKRAEEEKGYDPDCIVLWQKKAWADTATCIEWAQTAFKEFVEEAVEIAPADEVLLLADSLRSQTKSEFIAAVKASVRAITMFGVKNGSHVWQPVDHHVGAAYKRKMDSYYVEWMANCVPDLAAPSPTIPVGKRRQLLTEWAARAYRELEVARETAEREGRPSLFEAAFLRTGCLVTVDGTADDEIRPHTSIVDALATRFKAKIRAPHTFTPVELGEEESPLAIEPGPSSRRTATSRIRLREVRMTRRIGTTTPRRAATTPTASLSQCQTTSSSRLRMKAH